MGKRRWKTRAERCGGLRDVHFIPEGGKLVDRITRLGYLSIIRYWDTAVANANMLRCSWDIFTAKRKVTMLGERFLVTESNSHSEPRCCYRSHQSAESL